MITGMDTTAHTMSFTIYALARYPEIQKQCQEEVDKWIASPGAGAGADSLGSLPPYVEAVLKESMRRWPTAATGSFRVVRQPEGVQLTPTLHIPQGWWILVCIYALHNSKEAWGEDVNQFIPERWISKDGTLLKPEGDDAKEEEDPLSAVEESDESKSKTAEKNARADNSRLASASSYAGAGYSSDELCFVPFSNGLRNCIGMNLAMMELRITLFKLISKFHFSLGNEEAMKDENQIFETAFTMRPRHGCPIRISKR
jgi:cytochrome P450